MKNSKSNSSTNLWQRYAVLIIALLVIALSPAYAEQPTSGISFAQISVTNPASPQKYSQYGEVSINYTMLYGQGYINVERYENGQAAGWVVKNLPVISSSVLPGFSTMFDLGVSGYQSSLTAYVDYSATPLADDSSLKNHTPSIYQLAQAEYPISAPTFSGSAVHGQVNLYLQTEEAAALKSVTVVRVKNPAGGSDNNTIFWFDPKTPKEAPKHIPFTLPANATPEKAAEAIETAMNDYFKKNDYEKKFFAKWDKKTTVTVSLGKWASVNNDLVALTLD